MFGLHLVKPAIISLALLAFNHHASAASVITDNQANINQADILANAPHLDPEALKYAIDGYHWALAQGTVENPNILTVIDFNLPSNKKRLWVIDLRSDKVLMNAYAAHGKGSGTTYAQDFSNQPNSHATSLGVYKTLSTYYGHHGKSLRLQGLEKGINSNAYKRNIVVHSAKYVSPNYVKQNNRAGRSWGCFAMNPSMTNKFMSITKGGSIIFAYADEEKSDSVIA